MRPVTRIIQVPISRKNYIDTQMPTDKVHRLKREATYRATTNPGRRSRMKNMIVRQIVHRLGAVLAVLAGLIVFASVGYYFIGRHQYSLLDCLYMTFITISTIGFGEILDLSASPGGRVFTMLVALCGIGTLTYSFSMITATLVEGTLTDAFRQHKMEKKIAALSGHHIICCAERVGSHVVQELMTTLRPAVILEQHPEHLDEMLKRFPAALGLIGDSSDNDLLLKAGIERAAGLFAAHDDDNTNLVVCLTARHMNPRLRTIAHCREPKNSAKMKRAGADSVVSAEMIGGLRMASEMARPAAVTFLDLMLRDKDRNLRIEEVTVPERLAGQTLEALRLKKICNLLLLALREQDDWIYNPPPEQTVSAGSVLIFMGTPEERIKLEKAFQEKP